MGLLQEIIEGAVSGSTPIADVLRKCRVLGARLNVSKLSEWASKELNGYRNNDEIPDYRITHSIAKGDFSGSFGRAIKNYPIPPATLEARHRDLASIVKLLQPIASYEKCITDTRESAIIPWPPDITLYYQRRISKEYILMEAWQEIPQSSITDLFESVRNRMLNFSLDLEKEDPMAGTDPTEKSKMTKEQASQIFITNVYGNSNNISSASQNLKQNILIHEGDKDHLIESIRKCGANDSDLSELEKALSEDSLITQRGRIGENTAEWLGKIAKKIANGSFKAAGDAAYDTIYSAIKSYLGN